MVGLKFCINFCSALAARVTRPICNATTTSSKAFDFIYTFRLVEFHVVV